MVPTHIRNIFQIPECGEVEFFDLVGLKHVTLGLSLNLYTSISSLGGQK